MDKGAVNLDRATVYSVIAYMHQSLAQHGIEDNRIALFGSFLTGNTHEDSDIDMIVISKLFEGKNILERIKMTTKAELDVRRKFVVPMDILKMSPEEYEYSKTAYLNAEIVS
ncbi:MAG: nucleotidyltransferase domain-containing protein [Prevotellaceae bacterium]|jgi:predicted nucleotidyltransferase|nr:nucleotidyltransferase domain-containing protein [Prevotellaceae bacterium]